MVVAVVAAGACLLVLMVLLSIKLFCVKRKTFWQGEIQANKVLKVVPVVKPVGKESKPFQYEKMKEEEGDTVFHISK